MLDCMTRSISRDGVGRRLPAPPHSCTPTDRHREQRETKNATVVTLVQAASCESIEHGASAVVHLFEHSQQGRCILLVSGRASRLGRSPCIAMHTERFRDVMS